MELTDRAVERFSSLLPSDFDTRRNWCVEKRKTKLFPVLRRLGGSTPSMCSVGLVSRFGGVVYC